MARRSNVWHRYDLVGRQMALSASYDAMQCALEHAGKASPVEQAMIKALPARYPQREAIDDMAPRDKAYTKEPRDGACRGADQGVVLLSPDGDGS
jgi:hypothetical protein